jgi:D-3-phosphoglycerate dehydrogenase
MKVVVTDYIEPDLNWECEEFARRGVEFEYHQLKFAPDEKVIEATKDADVVLVNMVKITPAIVAGWSKTRLVIRHGVGFDNLDLDALEKAGIAPCYIPDYCAEEVAEQAIALILACGRRVVASRKVLDDSSARGAWDFAPMIPIFRMGGQTLGILGCGRIGSFVYQKLKSFGFRFLICDPYLTEERKRELGIETVDRETMFRGSDFITVHTPLSSETKHIVNRETLAMMKPSAYLVNTARGQMVDVDAGRCAETRRDSRRGHRRLRPGTASAGLPTVGIGERGSLAPPGMVFRRRRLDHSQTDRPGGGSVPGGPAAALCRQEDELE